MLAQLIESSAEVVSEWVAHVATELGIDASRDIGNGGGDLHPARAVLGYAILGGVLSYIGVQLLPHRLLGHALLPGGSIVVVPVAAGLALWGVGALRRRMQGRRARSRTFWYGYLFGLAVALVRLMLVQ